MVGGETPRNLDFLIFIYLFIFGRGVPNSHQESFLILIILLAVYRIQNSQQWAPLLLA